MIHEKYLNDPQFPQWITTSITVPVAGRINPSSDLISLRIQFILKEKNTLLCIYTLKIEFEVELSYMILFNLCYNLG
jgi:hypothetical protein